MIPTYFGMEQEKQLHMATGQTANVYYNTLFHPQPHILMKIRETYALGTACSWPQHMWVPETKHRADPALFTSPLETLTLIIHLAEDVCGVQRLLSTVFRLFSLLTNMLHKTQPKVTTSFHSCENQTSSLWKSTSFPLAYHSPLRYSYKPKESGF